MKSKTNHPEAPPRRVCMFQNHVFCHENETSTLKHDFSFFYQKSYFRRLLSVYVCLKSLCFMDQNCSNIHSQQLSCLNHDACWACMYVSKNRVLSCVLRLVPNLDLTLSSRELSEYVCMSQTYIHCQHALVINCVCMFQNLMFCRVLGTLDITRHSQHQSF